MQCCVKCVKFHVQPASFDLEGLISQTGYWKERLSTRRCLGMVKHTHTYKTCPKISLTQFHSLSDFVSRLMEWTHFHRWPPRSFVVILFLLHKGPGGVLLCFMLCCVCAWNDNTPTWGLEDPKRRFKKWEIPSPWARLAPVRYLAS